MCLWEEWRIQHCSKRKMGFFFVCFFKNNFLVIRISFLQWSLRWVTRDLESAQRFEIVFMYLKSVVSVMFFQVVDSLLLLFKRISDTVNKTGGCWVWRIQEGKWFSALLQKAFASIVNNNTFRFETHDLTFFYSDAASASTYREEIQDYRKVSRKNKRKKKKESDWSLQSKSGDLLLMVHELLSHADVQQKRAALWTVSFLCAEVERTARIMTTPNVDKKERNLAMRRLEACSWAFGMGKQRNMCFFSFSFFFFSLPRRACERCDGANEMHCSCALYDENAVQHSVQHRFDHHNCSLCVQVSGEENFCFSSF